MPSPPKRKRTTKRPRDIKTALQDLLDAKAGPGWSIETAKYSADIKAALFDELNANAGPGWSFTGRTRDRFEFWLLGEPAIIVQTFIEGGFIISRSSIESAEIDRVFPAIRAFFERRS